MNHHSQLDCFQQAGMVPAFGLVVESETMNKIDWDEIKNANKPDPNQIELDILTEQGGIVCHQKNVKICARN